MAQWQRSVLGLVSLGFDSRIVAFWVFEPHSKNHSRGRKSPKSIINIINLECVKAYNLTLLQISLLPPQRTRRHTFTVENATMSTTMSANTLERTRVTSPQLSAKAASLQSTLDRFSMEGSFGWCVAGIALLHSPPLSQTLYRKSVPGPGAGKD